MGLRQLQHSLILPFPLRLHTHTHTHTNTENASPSMLRCFSPPLRWSVVWRQILSASSQLLTGLNKCWGYQYNRGVGNAGSLRMAFHTGTET